MAFLPDALNHFSCPPLWIIHPVRFCPDGFAGKGAALTSEHGPNSASDETKAFEMKNEGVRNSKRLRSFLSQ
jgi:hypothetical protein